MNEIAKLIVSNKTTIREALEGLQAAAYGVLLMVDSGGKLIRTVTDGDIRRLLLAGAGFDQSLAFLPVQNPISVCFPCEEMIALEVMNKHKIDQIPVVDDEGRPLLVYRRRDVDSQILLSTPHIGTSELAYVEEAFRTNWIAPLGPNVDAFENELTELVGAGYAAAVSSGTAAIHLALRLLEVSEGDHVFCSSLTFVASANPILYERAVPVFIDSEPETWNMSPSALRKAFEQADMEGKLPKAVIVVNLYGQSADMDPILAICNHYQVPIIEDAAESLGATYKGRASGTLGRLGTYSFNGNKIITTSGGGMLVSDDFRLIARARHLSTQSREAAAHYEHTEVGYNYRMSNVLAGIGRGQLQVLNDRVQSRRHVFATYQRLLADVLEIEWMPEADFGKANRWLTACTLSGPLRPADLIRALANEKIEARPVWKPMHLQPLFAGRTFIPHLPGVDVAADLFQRGVCLPSGSNMTEEQVAKIANVIRKELRDPRPFV
jgi:dTDP-4-amino-4,6-dideoxygalactose transaminase